MESPIYQKEDSAPMPRHIVSPMLATINVDENHGDLVSQQLSIPEVKSSFVDIYRYASATDLLIVGLCSIAAIVAGACQPLPTIVFAHVVNVFADVERDGRAGPGTPSAIDGLTLYFLYIMIVSFGAQFASTAGFMFTGERITRRIKKRLMESILKQNMALFDEEGTGMFTTLLTSDTHAIQSGISHKLALTFAAAGTLGATFIICFAMYWKLTLMLVWSIALGVILIYSGGFISIKYGTAASNAHAAGGTTAEETFGSMKSATALGMQGDVLSRYDRHLKSEGAYAFRMKAFMGSMVGFAVGSGYINVALAFWQGARFLTDGKASFINIVAITLAIKAAAFSVLGVASNAEAFTAAVASANRIISIINRPSPIDPTSTAGNIPGNLGGHIEFRNVMHQYPSRPGVVVAKNLNLVFKPGTSTAIVGASGAGKSTILNLIERFYDPLQGQILLDGQDTKQLNIRWLRRQMRVSSQDPMLFDTTIFENIAYGLEGSPLENANEDKKQELVRAAAEIACAHEFIMILPQNYETQAGLRGSKLSGGQRQRIAIARAIVSNPRILILDEATSALDPETEAKVLAGLRKTTSGRTTIVVAHRLSTIKDSDTIFMLQQGRIEESGPHEELMACHGPYFELVRAQSENPVAKLDTRTHEGSVVESELPSPLQSVSRSEARGEKGVDGSTSGASDVTSTNPSKWAMAKFVAAFNRKEAGLCLIGLLASIVAGCEESASAILFGKAITAISLPIAQGVQIRSQAGFYSYMFLLLALVQLLVFIIQGVVFAWCSERLIERARHQALDSILHQDMAFFDKKENSPGSLTSFLSTEATDLAGISGSTFGTILIAISSVIAGFVVGVSFNWKLGLVCSSVLPVLLACGYYGIKIVGRFQFQSEAAAQASANYAGEAVSAIRDIASLTREGSVLQTFSQSLDVSANKSLISTLKSSLMYATAQSLLYGCMGIGFWYGGKLVTQLDLSLYHFTVSYMSVIMSAFSAGLVFSFAPDMGRAAKSAYSLQRLLNSQPKLDARSRDGKLLHDFQGNVEFRNVCLVYPERPGHDAVKDLSFFAKAGQNIALVGETGSGKSTVISLLERFYDATGGQILIDGVPLQSINVKAYRRNVGLVIQEPTLYDGTIRENLMLGLDDTVSEAQIVQACRDASIYDFIVSLPDQFRTIVGNRGSKLSGGQKQRLALARALLRDPKILLLDEATSAVDSQSEQLIQDAMDRASSQRSRTTITVAHRLSTVRRADVIYVMEKGSIIEAGSHEELCARRAKYWTLLSANALPL